MSYFLIAIALYAVGGTLTAIGLILWFAACCCVAKKRKTNPKFKCCQEPRSKAGAVFFSIGAAFIIIASGIYGAKVVGGGGSSPSPSAPKSPTSPSNPSSNPAQCAATQYTCPACNSPAPQQACLYCKAACLCHNACQKQCCLQNSQSAQSLGTNCGYSC